MRDNTKIVAMIAKGWSFAVFVTPDKNDATISIRRGEVEINKCISFAGQPISDEERMNVLGRSIAEVCQEANR